MVVVTKKRGNGSGLDVVIDLTPNHAKNEKCNDFTLMNFSYGKEKRVLFSKYSK